MKFKSFYESACRFAGRFEDLKNSHDPPEELENNIRVANLDVQGEEVVSLGVFGALIGGIITGVVLFLSFLFGFSRIIPIIAVSFPILLYLSVGFYPSWLAEKVRTNGMSGVPRLISYLTASLKINPNLEKAAIFSANRTEESLGENFRSELWKACIGAHNNVREALTSFGRKWKGESEELKRSIDLIKSSVSEKNRDTREQVLDQALSTSFEGVRKRMESFATGLQLPTILIYGLGVLLPLVLLAVLPVLSSTGVQLSGIELGLIYCLVLPGVIYVLQKEVLSQRPAAFGSPNIPSKDNEKKATIVGVLILVLPPTITHFTKLPNTLQALTTIWSVSSAIATYCYLSTHKTYETRQINKKLEKELSDALTQLGSQLKSKRPIEKALKRTAMTTKGGRISTILERTSKSTQNQCYTHSACSSAC